MWDWELVCKKEVEFISDMLSFRAFSISKSKLPVGRCLPSEAQERSLGCRYRAGNHI